MDPNPESQRCVMFAPKRHKIQCVNWHCQRVPSKPMVYCHVLCEEMATSQAQATVPFFLSDSYSDTKEFALVAGKIFHWIKAGKEPGVPKQSQDVFHIPPWKSSVFSTECREWGHCREWLFLGSFKIPETSDFEWVEERSKVVGEVRHCVLKPFPEPEEEDNRWMLHQYSSVDIMEDAVYVMHYNKQPLSAAEEDEETDSEDGNLAAEEDEGSESDS